MNANKIMSELNGKIKIALVLCYAFLGITEADMLGYPGESILIPVVIYDKANGINTTISITVPSKTGASVIANTFTAKHSSPSSLPNNPVRIHWTFMDKTGLRLLDNHFDTLPDRITKLDWGSIVGPIQALQGKPGYLLVQTEQGYQGLDANFNMFAEATLSVKSKASAIPVYAMNDGADNVAANVLDYNNEVSINPVTHEIMLSPLASGIRMKMMDSSSLYAGYDLVLGRRGKSYCSRLIACKNPAPEPTLLIVWNDGNYSQWNHIPLSVYDSSGNYCSSMIDASKKLNIYWVLSPGESIPVSPIPGVVYSYLCDPNAGSFQPGFVRLSFANPNGEQNTASAAFSFVLGATAANVNLARERGRFEASP